ncbi:hypothetical protein [Streptomyces sp. CBMA123]|uniref:hypothetical protein n=1 Tax=Streptomyces sp. CBMA123 TaxID=1896313 RepID=UPI0016620334|nr:hypothetical protein [Streptomyces sp. CBMA123]MBD0689983.1 hypothetical protein [Streptomyces sp. CBMA123]
MTSNDADARSEAIAVELAPRGAHRSRMFGMPCLKDVNGKAFAGLRGNELVCRLGRDSAEHAEAPALAGAHLSDLAGGRPMKDRACLPGTAADRRQRCAEAALAAQR